MSGINNELLNAKTATYKFSNHPTHKLSSEPSRQFSKKETHITII